MRPLILVLVLTFFQKALIYAQPAMEHVEGLPTNEIYDLHVDSKGYLWIAHGLGISRYDGLNFIHFSNPNLATLRMSDLVEDQQGRIWCHNFSGQLFYIEQGKLTFLASYDYKKESQFSRMALCGDELVVTSQFGLFVCSTKTLEGKYIPLDTATGTGQVSLAVIGKKMVIYNHLNWYLYQQSTGIQKLTVDPAIDIAKDNTVSLQPPSYNDTFFLTTNPAGTLQKLVLQGTYVKRVAKVEYNDYINAVTVNDKLWVHTRNKSITLYGSSVIKDNSLTDIVSGKEGNTWYSSMREGLMVTYRPSKWKRIQFPIGKGDYVKSLNVGDGYFFAGTQKGYLYMMKRENSAPSWRYNMFNGYGSVDFIRYFKNHQFVVGTSTNTYIINPLTKKINDPLPFKSVVDVDFDEHTLYLATPNGFYMLPYPNTALNRSGWEKVKQQQFPFYAFHQTTNAPYLILPQRSRAVRLDKQLQEIFVSTKNGLRLVTPKGIQPFYLNGKEVFASSLWYQYPRLYIATINDGLWIKEGNSFQHLTASNYLFSNTIVRIKMTANHLWLLENNGVQVMDIKSNRILHYIDMPKIIGADVFDIAEKEGYAYLTTSEGIYKIPMQVTVEKKHR